MHRTSDAELESQRLEGLRATGLLDSPPEEAFDEVTRFAAQLFGAPIAVISLVDEQRIWFKSAFGLDAREIPRADAFCGQVVDSQGDLLVVPDALADERFRNSAIVTGGPCVRFYVGASIRDRNGFAVGTLCVLDRVPREVDAKLLDALRLLARQVAREIDLRRAALEALATRDVLARAESRLSLLNELSSAIRPGLEVNDVIQRVLTIIYAAFPDLRVAYSTISPENQLDIIDSVGPASMPSIAGVSLSLNVIPEYLALLRAGKVAAIPEVSREPLLATVAEVYASVSIVGVLDVPMFTGDQLDGLLCFDSPVPRKWSEHEIALLPEVARHIGHYIQNARTEADKRRSNELLLATEERWHLAIEGTSDGIWDWSAATGGLYLSERCLQLLGLDSSQGLGEAVEASKRQIHSEDLPGLQLSIQSHVDSGSAIAHEFRARCKAEEWRWLLCRGKAVRSPQGLVTRIVGSLSDVTERKRFEEALQLALDAAVESTRHKSQFLANMSHELRTPMSGAIGMTELLLTTNLTREQREYAETIRSSGRSLLAVINDVLDYSKIEAGKLELESLEFDPRTIVEDVIQLFALSAQSKGLEIAQIVEPGMPALVRGDPNRLRQVLTNLVGNAVKFTESGEVRLRASTRASDSSTCELRFVIEDTGIGLSPSAKSRLFQSFMQADNSTTRRFGGTGLGLAISRELVQLMRGVIGVESEADQGTSFWFTAQFALPAAAVVDGQTVEAPLQRALYITTSPLRREHLVREYAALGMRTETAQGRDSAWAALEPRNDSNSAFDLILIDAELLADWSSAHIIQLRQRAPGARLVCVARAHAQSEPHPCDGRVSVPSRRSKLASELASAVSVEPLSVLPFRPPTSEHSVGVPSPQRGRILLAEDNSVNQRVAARLLELRGFEVVVAGNGVIAAQTAAAQTFELILMDLHMPLADGFEATRRIRAQGGHNLHVPIVALTACVFDEERQRCLDVGMNHFLAKPLDIAKLDAALERWVGRTV